MLKTQEMAHLAPTKGYSWLSPNVAMQFALLGCTHPPPLVPGSNTDAAYDHWVQGVVVAIATETWNFISQIRYIKCISIKDPILHMRLLGFTHHYTSASKHACIYPDHTSYAPRLKATMHQNSFCTSPLESHDLNNEPPSLISR